MEPVPRRGRRILSRAFVVATLWIALVTGLVEGAGSMIIEKVGNLPGAWWDLLWISPIFDLAMFALAGVPLAWLAVRLGRDSLRFALPFYLFLTASIWLGLALPYQVHVVALLLLSAGVATQLTRWFRRHEEAVLAFVRRTLPAVSGLFVLAFVSVALGRPIRERLEVALLPPVPDGAPDIVLVVIDALRSDHLSAYGYPRETSPTLDRLAREGVLFEAAFSSSPYTAPSHASLLTGVYPTEHGVQWIERRPILRDGPRTIAEVLAERGYRTGAFSANRFWFTREQGFGRGFHHFEDNFHSLGDALVRTAYGRKLDDWVLIRLFEDYPWRKKADQVTDAALRWVEAGGEHPFFVVLNYFDVHDPYFPPDPYRAWFSDVARPGGILNSHQGRYLPELTPDQLQEEIDAYDGAIRYVDAEIERLLDGLRAAGADDLVVVVTSDHGEAFGEHGTYIHANSLYREEIQVPLIVWSPGSVPRGMRIDEVVTNAAVPATLLDILDVPPEPRFRLASLEPLWTGSAASPDHVFSEMEHWPWNREASPSHYGAIQAVITPEFHLIRNDSLGTELYRWREDPLEAADLMRGDSMSAVARGLAGLLQRLDRPYVTRLDLSSR